MKKNLLSVCLVFYAIAALVCIVLNVVCICKGNYFNIWAWLGNMRDVRMILYVIQELFGIPAIILGVLAIKKGVA